MCQKKLKWRMLSQKNSCWFFRDSNAFATGIAETGRRCQREFWIRSWNRRGCDFPWKFVLNEDCALLGINTAQKLKFSGEFHFLKGRHSFSLKSKENNEINPYKLTFRCQQSITENYGSFHESGLSFTTSISVDQVICRALCVKRNHIHALRCKPSVRNLALKATKWPKRAVIDT